MFKEENGVFLPAGALSPSEVGRPGREETGREFLLLVAGPFSAAEVLMDALVNGLEMLEFEGLLSSYLEDIFGLSLVFGGG